MAGRPGQPPPQAPPGPPQGPQSRRNRLAERLLPALFGVLALPFGAGMFATGLATDDWRFMLAGVGGGGLFAAVAVRAVVQGRQRRAGRALELALEPPQLRRGERLSARLRLPDAEGDGVELRLACTVRYDVRRGSGDDRRRVTASAVAYEHAVSLSGSQPLHAVPLELPREAPYSHEGRCLSFVWTVSARQRRRGVDRVHEQPLWVLP